MEKVLLQVSAGIVCSMHLNVASVMDHTAEAVCCSTYVNGLWCTMNCIHSIDVKI